MGNVLEKAKQEQVIALGRLGWSLPADRGGAEPVTVDQILPDTHRVAAARQLQLDHPGKGMQVPYFRCDSSKKW